MLRKTFIIASLLSPLLVAAPVSAQPLPQPSPQAQQVQAVNLNTASAEQLAMGLTGVGLKRAEAIVELRTKLGGFTDVNQLLQVKGIGPRMLELNRERMQL
ncbi:ComEA family DNA-binding protein [Pseudidiomarina mangrovi]|uniref:ComEA family DNA-binding protein n=1 Tax=Pseudidiomarina mangrovi TaxID=2487133 RepID=UPI000FCAAA76|nr:ComEA family DNA-binding protein [Pseudidiomarina mangrovi]CAI8165886.1 MAG: ComE operon protein 1 [Pseudidiomarina mangrovi]